MPEQTEWEIVDTPAPGARSGAFGPDASISGNAASTWMEAALGRYWKLKIAGIATAGIALLVFVVMLTGVVMVALASIALLSFGIAKLRKLMHRDSHAGTDVQRH